jgi:membrane protease YdiL (CAAX protease family)
MVAIVAPVLLACAGTSLADGGANGGADGGTSGGAGSDPVDAVSYGVGVVGLLVLAWLWRRDVIRPGSIVRHGSRGGTATGGDVVPGVPWTVLFMAVLALLILQALAATLGGMLGMGLPARLESTLAKGAIVGVVVYAATIAGAGLVLAGLSRIGTGGESLRPMIRGRDLARGAAWMVLVFPAIQAGSLGTVLVYRLVKGEAPDRVGHDTLRLLVENPREPWVWVSVALAVLAAPVAEELIFRGLLQTGMRKATRSMGAGPGVGVVVSTLLFTLVHLGGGVPMERAYALVPIFLVGLACGIAYERTGRLGVPIAMHVVFNAANVALAVLWLTP